MILCCLYLSGGLAYMLPHPSAEASGYRYWRFDVNEIHEPYGVLEAGWSHRIGKFRLEIAGRHDSSIPVGDYGQNTVEVRVRWYPFH